MVIKLILILFFKDNQQDLQPRRYQYAFWALYLVHQFWHYFSIYVWDVSALWLMNSVHQDCYEKMTLNIFNFLGLSIYYFKITVPITVIIILCISCLPCLLYMIWSVGSEFIDDHSSREKLT